MSDQLIHDIQAASQTLKRPDGDAYRSLAVPEIQKIAAAAGLSGREVEVAALEIGIIPERYTRNMKSLSAAEQVKLLNSTVSIVGLGGLGGTVTEMLARIGIGRLNLIDGDVFEDSNLNRQITSTTAKVGLSKADTARKRVAQINPGLSVTTQQLFLDEQNAAKLIAGSDVVVDCLDSLKSRYFLAVACRNAGAPLVVAAVAGLSGQVTVFFPGDIGFESVYGVPGEMPEKGVETRLGNLAPIVGMIANIECAEAVKILLGRGNPLRNRMLLVDLLESTFETIDLV